MINKDSVLTKYFFCTSKSLPDTLETFKRQQHQTITGWFDSKNEWFPITFYHSHPAYIKRLRFEGELDITNSLHIKKFYQYIKKYKTKGSDLFYENQNKQMYKCIADGAVRIIVRNKQTFLDANSLVRANKAFTSLLQIFPSLTDYKHTAVVNVLDKNGNLTFEGYYDETKEKFKRSIINLYD